MKYISHRGNLCGRIPQLENKPIYIDTAISAGVDVEVDLHVIASTLYLSHDDIWSESCWTISPEFLFERKDKLWIHAKNLNAVQWLIENGQELNWFWHETDQLSITSKNWIWTADYMKTGNNIILMDTVSDDRYLLELFPNTYISGLCSDYIIPLRAKYGYK
jgi:hypothetical protein